MKFSIETLLYLKNFSYFRLAKLAELAKSPNENYVHN